MPEKFVEIFRYQIFEKTFEVSTKFSCILRPYAYFLWAFQGENFQTFNRQQREKRRELPHSLPNSSNHLNPLTTYNPARAYFPLLEPI